ncbi:MAG: hypothetical protein IJ462_03755 [Clostridia bacterium]|nr:hypothetical protein [Clostridia bacterium]
MTNSVKSITDEMIDVLKMYDQNDEYVFCGAFDNSYKPCPLLKPTAVLGVKEICLGEGGFGEYLGTDANGNTVMGKRCDVTLSLKLFMPRSMGQDVGSFFEVIASVLSGGPLSSGILSLSIGETSSDKLLDCFMANGEIKLRAIFNTVSSKNRFASSFSIRQDN